MFIEAVALDAKNESDGIAHWYKSVHRTVGVSPILGFAVKSLKQDCGVEI